MVQEDALTAEEYVPAPQSEHVAVPPTEYVPGVKVSQAFVSVLDLVPFPHNVQALEPSAVPTNPTVWSHLRHSFAADWEYLPTGQLPQSPPFALVSEYLPAGHAVQEEAPPTLNDPLEHTSQLSWAP